MKNMKNTRVMWLAHGFKKRESIENEKPFVFFAGLKWLFAPPCPEWTNKNPEGVSGDLTASAAVAGGFRAI